MYVVGGLGGDGGPAAPVLSDVYSLTLTGGAAAWRWALQPSAAGAQPVYGHALIASGALLVLYGALTTGAQPVPAAANGGVLSVSTSRGAAPP
jgi:hypothetical protein